MNLRPDPPSGPLTEWAVEVVLPMSALIILTVLAFLTFFL